MTSLSERRAELNKAADDESTPEGSSWEGSEGRGIAPEPIRYTARTPTKAVATHTYMNNYKGQNEPFAFLGEYKHGIPDNSKGEPSGDEVLKPKGRTFCKHNGGILGDVKRLLGDVSDSVYIRNKSGKGRCLPIEYIRTPHKDKGNKWPVQNIDNNGQLEAGIPCPGADQIYYNGVTNEFKCYYENLDANRLQYLYDNRNNNQQTKDTYEQIANEFCSNPANIDQIITTDGEQNCRTRDANNKVLNEFCEKDDHIKRDSTCTTDETGKALPKTEYDRIAEKFCEENPKDDWCSCYNVSSGVCDDNPDSDAAGCEKWKIEKSSVTDIIGEDNLQAALLQDARCVISDCNKSGVYMSRSNPRDCELTFNICSQIIDVGAAAASPLTASCDIDATETNETTTDTDITTNNDTTINNDTTDDALLAAFADADGEGDDEGDNSQNLYIGLGLLGAIICSCCCAAIILFIMMKKK